MTLQKRCFVTWTIWADGDCCAHRKSEYRLNHSRDFYVLRIEKLRPSLAFLQAGLLVAYPFDCLTGGQVVDIDLV